MNASPSPSLAVPELIAQIIFVLCQTVSMRVRAATVTPAQVSYIVRRLLGIRGRFRRLVARIQAGRPPAERARRPRPNKAEPASEFPLGFRPPPPGWRRWAVAEDKPVPAWRSLRQHTFAWMCWVAPAVPGFRDSAAAHGEALRRLLAEPEMQALLLTSRLVGDRLRPLCWMLGVKTSILYPARPAASAAVLTANPSVPAPDENDAPAVAAPGPGVSAVVGSPLAWPRDEPGDDFFAMA